MRLRANSNLFEHVTATTAFGRCYIFASVDSLDQCSSYFRKNTYRTKATIPSKDKANMDEGHSITIRTPAGGNQMSSLHDLTQPESMLSIILETLYVLLVLLFYAIWGPIKALLPYEVLPQKSLENEIIVITGAASGIGRLLSIRFARHGARLALIDVNLDGLERTKKLIHDEKQDANVRTYRCDLTDRLDIYRVMDQMKTDLGNVDILINNAGIVTGKKILECPDELMIKTMNVNTLAHFWTIKSVLPSMLERNHGHIVTISSAGGLTGTAGLVDYCASKFAAFGLTESLAFELRSLRKHGVYTTTVCPFYINTGMFHGTVTRFPLLLPILEPEYVADQTVNAILTNQEVLIMPKLLYWGCYLKTALPAQAAYLVADFLGITKSMDMFMGRNASANGSG